MTASSPVLVTTPEAEHSHVFTAAQPPTPLPGAQVAANGDDDDGVDGDWDGPAIRECFAKPHMLARKADVVVATYGLQARVSIDRHFQV